MEILTDRVRVQKLLESKPHLRNNDNKLIANLFYQEVKSKGDNPESASALSFITDFSEGKIINPQSVIRLRCKLQEEFPHLRGHVWEARHKEEPKVIRDINTIGNE